MVERTILESSSDFIDIESEPGASVFIVPNEQDNTEEYDKVLNYHNNERLNSSVTIDSLSLVSSKKEYLPARRQGRIGLIRSLDQTWREPQVIFFKYYNIELPTYLIFSESHIPYSFAFPFSLRL